MRRAFAFDMIGLRASQVRAFRMFVRGQRVGHAAPVVANIEILESRSSSHVLQFTERVVIHRARLAPEGSTATAYAWLVWLNGGLTEDGETLFGWLAPCRKRLEQRCDYA